MRCRGTSTSGARSIDIRQRPIASSRGARRRSACSFHDRNQRRGAAAVELAISVPLIVLIVFGSLEASNMLHLSQTLHVVSYEAARLATQRSSSTSEVIDRANELLVARNVQSASVTLDPPDLSAVVQGQTVTISVEAPCNPNSVITSFFFQGRTLIGQTTMVKEQIF